ncbi:MAG: phytoene desaturase [Methylocystis sp.]|jgi:phytoene desaturase|nr:phytoene desaturase [Methylocystis sp.]MCA3583723.1 phytoene desaturase [Methylocystis sp.]MCA3587735.1 phytoene desaturase [Methylocystis sp.]MCA3590003.1 phytoene desaturase [Methylocystis sp.]
MTAPLRFPLPIDSKRPHAIVIGAGFGGLAMAIRLAVKGYQVSVFEHLEQAGGRANVYRQDGFTFDAGPTIVTAPYLLEELWELCGKKLQDDVPLVAMNPFYQIRFNDGSVMNCSGDAAAMRAEVERLSPGDVAGYERFMALSERTFTIGFEKLGNQPFNTLWDMAKAVPQILMLGGIRSIHGMVSRYVKDERIRIALSFHPLFIGGNPLKASAVYGLVAYLERHWGVHFAMGGTGALIKGMVRLLEDQGGRIFYNTRVDGILAEGKRATGVKLATGEEVPAHLVACNADAAWTYANLLPGRVRNPLMSLRLKKAAFSCGIFIWYFGTRRRYEDVHHHTIVLGPRYEGLLRDIFQKKKLADDFSLYLYRPTATDPSLAPEGCDSFYVLAPVPHLAADVDWTTKAEPYRRAVEARLMETILPGLKDDIVTSKVMTPLDFQSRFLSPHGAGFGMEPILSQSAYFRPQNKSHWLENLFMVGAGTHPGAGIPGVLTSARIAGEMVPNPEVFA